MDNFSALIDALIKSEVRGQPQHEKLLSLGETPDFLLHHGGFPQLQLMISGKTIGKAYFDHGITQSTLKRLPDIIREPKALFRSDSRPDSGVVFTFEVKGDAPLIIPVHPNEQRGRGLFVNSIASVYAKEGPDPYAKWTHKGLLLWAP